MKSLFAYIFIICLLVLYIVLGKKFSNLLKYKNNFPKFLFFTKLQSFDTVKGILKIASEK